MKFFRHIPWLPFSALLFYCTIVLLWQLGVAPSPLEIIGLLEGLYNSYGLIGLFIASFLEGIVYLGLYFPGSFVVAIAAVLSDGSFWAILQITLTVVVALTLTSIINYYFGRHIANRREKQLLAETKKMLVSKGIASFFHPNAMAFYFFASGIQKHSVKRILLVPCILISYGLFLGLIFVTFREGTRAFVESPFAMIIALFTWFILATMYRAYKLGRM